MSERATPDVAGVSIYDGDQALVADKRCRWFLRVGATTTFAKGFTSKKNASEWISSLGYSLDWQAGFVFRMKSSRYDCEIVDRRGVRAPV